eukprot:GHVL01023567.1.p1 GENE.GHVL01023567.1~~GHVL01023567.1.p1  ORF type:complete len:438 (+),score=40.97 GHVL01023567.1:67-1380(+)
MVDLSKLPKMHDHLQSLSSMCFVGTMILFIKRFWSHVVFGQRVSELKGLVFSTKQTRLTLQILCLFPILALCSWGALINIRQAMLLDVLKHLYEMVTLFWFWDLVVTILGGAEPALEVLIQRPPFKIYGVPPILCFRPFVKCRSFTKKDFKITKLLVAQYAYIGPAIALTDTLNETYFPYLHFMRMISGIVCMWGVVIIFTASRIALYEFRVTLKFISVKCTVLVMNALTLLIHQVVPGIDDVYDQEVMADAWTNFMYCVMTLLLMSIAYVAYPPSDISLREKRVNGFEIDGSVYPKTPNYSAKSSTFAQVANQWNDERKRRASHDSMAKTSMLSSESTEELDEAPEYGFRLIKGMIIPNNSNPTLYGSKSRSTPSVAIRTPRHRLTSIGTPKRFDSLKILEEGQTSNKEPSETPDTVTSAPDSASRVSSSASDRLS